MFAVLSDRQRAYEFRIKDSSRTARVLKYLAIPFDHEWLFNQLK